MMKNTISLQQAIRSAMTYLQLEAINAFSVFATLDHGIYELRFNTDWMHYECYVDANSAEILGVSTEPCVAELQGNYPAPVMLAA